MGKQITILTVHYNTPKMMEACLRSLAKHIPAARIIIFDNSDRLPFSANNAHLPFPVTINRLPFSASSDSAAATKTSLGSVPSGTAAGSIEILDNTHSQVINFGQWLKQFPDRKPASSNYGSPKHCKTIDLCFDLFPDGFILMDSDVLFKKDITPLWDETKAFVGEPHLDTPKGVHVMRLLPFLCYINVPMCRKNNIRYFNAEWMWHLTQKLPNKWYDTGAWFYKDCMTKQMPYSEIKTSDYIEHYFHGSHANLNGGMNDWLRKNKKLWI